MKLKTLMIISALVETGFGLTVLLFPTQLVSIVAASLSEPEGLIYTRLFGAAILSFGVLSWSARDTSDKRGPVVSALLLYNVVATIVLVLAQVNGLRGSWGWTIVVLHTLFALGFGYFRFSPD